MNSTTESLIKPFDLHVLVCTNTRVAPPALPDGTPAPPPKQSCGPLGADVIRADLKAWLHSELKSRAKIAGHVRVRVNGSGCLDFCKKGIAIAIYPQSEFLLFVKNTPESIADVKERIRAQLDLLEQSLDAPTTEA